MVAEVFFTAVAQPDSQCLGDFFALLRAEGFVESDGCVAFPAAGFITMGVP